MAVGDLVTDDYMFEYNGLAIGATTDYGLTMVRNLIGYGSHRSSALRFGAHGMHAGRTYAIEKLPIFDGEIRITDDADFETKRRALTSAFQITVGPDDRELLVFRLPGAGTKVQALCSCLGVDLEIDRLHSINVPRFKVRLEMADPILYALTAVNTVFTVSSDTQSIANNGNAPAGWTASLLGPATNPILTHNGTGQVIAFTQLELTGSDTLVYDSYEGTVKVNGVDKGNFIQGDFSWFDLLPGSNSISLSATDASMATFTLTHRDAYWTV